MWLLGATSTSRGSRAKRLSHSYTSTARPVYTHYVKGTISVRKFDFGKASQDICDFLPVKIVNLAQKLKWTIFQVLLDKIGPSTHCVYNRKCSKRLIPAYAFGETSIFSAMIPNQETKTFAAISLESSNLSLLLFDDIKNLANTLIFFMKKKIGSTCHEWRHLWCHCFSHNSKEL